MVCTMMMTFGPSSARAAATGSQTASDESNRVGPRVAPSAPQISRMKQNSLHSHCQRRGRVDTIPGGKSSAFSQPAKRPIVVGPGGLAGRAELGAARQVDQDVCDLIAKSVRFLAFNFFIMLRTWTLTVLSHMFRS